ncbi:hypothetical protein EYZ11_000090 [Aspergillus tanneri]|uniref:Zn(2)-C6 fungal-type domain-containing protein n=1 Tax=Aspergillus tanneri TaxID=1220188 RepID=A0A4S3JXV2_9EURO|nr:hypothetical protein EYZ11_000090 [Aspergillus tanneri]
MYVVPRLGFEEDLRLSAPTRLGDEQKPECSQCRKGGRECRPSEGIVFRHQQNASMNKDLDDSSAGRGNLKGFYSYKNTFDKDSVWLDIPKHVIFVDNSDPYADELEAALGESEAAILAANSQSQNLNAPRISSAEEEARGLGALSTAAVHDRLSYPSLSVERQQALATTDTGFNTVPTTSIASRPSPNLPRGAIPSLTSPPLSINSSNNNTNNNINFLLNPSQSLSPPVDPTIQQESERRSSSLTTRSSVARGAKTVDQRPDTPVETEHEIAFLLRNFSEAPGLWMDLFDLGTYFASHIPVRALTNPLLKYAACAYSAKQLGRAKNGNPPAGGVSLTQALMDTKAVDWCWYGAKYYEKAIQLLMKELQPDKGPPPLSTPEAFGQWQAAELSENGNNPHKRRRRYSESRRSSGVHSDETLAATAILSVALRLEKLHINLQKGQDFHGREKRRFGTLPGKIIWLPTRLNTEDLVLWTEAGLQIDAMGFVCPSNTNAAGYPEGDESIKEDVIGNGLIWILSKIVNFISAGDHLPLENGSVDSGPLGISQQALLERWYRLEAELDSWYNGLPDTFRPCARLQPKDSEGSGDTSGLSELWYTIPLCSSAMQHYHMARILLLINKPHESTSRRSTITNRLNSYRSIENEIRFHSREIVGISMGRPSGAVRINSLQPLFVSGQCLTEPGERRMVLQLLQGIETELGWATGYRVNQLLREWGWNIGSGEVTVP